MTKKSFLLARSNPHCGARDVIIYDCVDDDEPNRKLKAPRTSRYFRERAGLKHAPAPGRTRTGSCVKPSIYWAQGPEDLSLR